MDSVYKSGSRLRTLPQSPRGNPTMSAKNLSRKSLVKGGYGQSPPLVITKYYNAAIEAIESPSRIFMMRTP